MPEMSYAEFVASLSNPNMDPMEHACIGMLGELGELVDIFKRKVAYNKPLNREHLLEELGDFRFYLRMACNKVSKSGVSYYSGSFSTFDLLFKIAKCIAKFRRKPTAKNLDKIVFHYTCLEFNYHFTKEQVIEANMAKLKLRYPSGKYSDEQALARADKANDAV